MAFLDRITVNPELCEGSPCLRGMPIPVGDVLTRLREGVSESELLTEYPALVSDDIRACQEYQAAHLPSMVGQNSAWESSGILDGIFESLIESICSAVWNCFSW